MNISFVIPALNEEDYIPECLCAIKQAMKGLNLNYEIIVVDNQSIDKTVEFAYKFGAHKVVYSKNDSIAGVRNHGEWYAEGDFVIFVDADCLVSRELITETYTQLFIHNKQLVGTTLECRELSILGSLACKLWNRYALKNNIIHGSFTGIPKRRNTEIYNQLIYILEDIQLSKRVALAERVVLNIPLKISARKLQLYSFKHHVKLWWNFLFNFQKLITTRELCYMWYEGKR